MNDKPRVKYYPQKKKRLPKVVVRCGCGCGNKVEIYVYEDVVNGVVVNSDLEINGVLADTGEWRKILLPILKKHKKPLPQFKFVPCHK
jgi:hypothetical protein